MRFEVVFEHFFQVKAGFLFGKNRLFFESKAQTLFDTYRQATVVYMQRCTVLEARGVWPDG
ncbi:MAG: hypothetical protein IPJ88_13910 [Myxococcales bacterium]|nr:MAG: hypothetical protein IPJ88_13910 [Myxococcales bacterium]